MPVQPVVLVLLVGATVLVAAACAVAWALHRRRTGPAPAKQGDQPPRPMSPVPRSPQDETDPDLIPNKYDFVERRPLKSFMKIYKTPPEKRKRKEGDGEEEAEKLRGSEDMEDLHHYNHNNVQGPIRNSGTISDTLIVKSHNQKLGPEVVTANHRIQESCI